MIACSNCDGLGWLYLSEFREATPDGIVGDDPSVVFTKSDFDDDISICPDCDGFGGNSGYRIYMACKALDHYSWAPYI